MALAAPLEIRKGEDWEMSSNPARYIAALRAEQRDELQHPPKPNRKQRRAEARAARKAQRSHS